MPKHGGWFPAGAAALLSVGVLNGGAAAAGLSQAGTVTVVVQDARASQDNVSRPLATMAVVHEREVITTGPGSGVEITFADGARLALGPGSQATVHRYTYDPETRRGRLSLDVSSGLFEFESGAMRKDGYQIGTPFAQLELRGTRFGVEVANEAIFVVEGEAVARFLTGEVLSLKPSECTFRSPDFRRGTDGRACDPVELQYTELVALLNAARQAVTPVDLQVRALFLRFPSPDQGVAISPN